MAPLRDLPNKSAKPGKSILKQRDGQTLFTTSKQDKRRIKHAQLMTKVSKASGTKQKRRRPSKKLVTTLESLADALPDEDQDHRKTAVADQVHIIKRKSIKSRPGAMKRRQQIDNKERDRFAKNLAQMNASSSTATSTITAADKLKALRGFISQTLETRPEVSQSTPS